MPRSTIYRTYNRVGRKAPAAPPRPRTRQERDPNCLLALSRTAHGARFAQYLVNSSIPIVWIQKKKKTAQDLCGKGLQRMYVPCTL